MPRYFAIVPAAGHSTRMGRPKLLLPLAGTPLVLHTISAWRQGGVDSITAVARGDDESLASILQSAGVDVVMPPLPPPDMKASVQAALSHIERLHAPAADDAFLVAPADLPQLSPEMIRALIARHAREAGSLLVPTLAGRRGHPALYPWPLARAVFALTSNEGLNALADRFPLEEIACDGLLPVGSRPFADIDTPEQYRAAGGEYEGGQKDPRTEEPQNQS